MANIDLGDELRGDPDVRIIYAENNCIISIMNDAFSLRRELRFPFYNNALVILFIPYRQSSRILSNYIPFHLSNIFSHFLPLINSEL